MTLAILGYGRVDVLCAALGVYERQGALDRAAGVGRRRLEREAAVYRRYARTLAAMYPYWGSGADEQDVEQVALIAALNALERYEPSLGARSAWVRKKMQWAVKDFVRIRTERQRAERLTVPLDANA